MTTMVEIMNSTTTSSTTERGSSPIVKRLKSSTTHDNSNISHDDVCGAGATSTTNKPQQTSELIGAAAIVRSTTTSSSSSLSSLHSNGEFPIVDDDSLRNILSYVGDHYYMYIGCVNRTFEKTYVSLFPEKSTYLIASTIGHAKFCWDHLTAGKKSDYDKDKLYMMLWHSAARYGKVDVVKYLVPQFERETDGSDSKLRVYDWRYDLCPKAAVYGNLELLRWACQENIFVVKDNGDVCINALGGGHLDVFHEAVKYGFVFDDVFAVLGAQKACQNGKIEALQWLQDNNYDVIGRKYDEVPRCACCFYAAIHGQLDLLKWVQENYGLDCDDYTIDNAISRGHVDVVEFMLCNGCQFYTSHYWTAAYFGHLAILQLLDSYGVELDVEVVADYAAASGHLECLQWVLDNECDMTESTCKYAAGFGQFDILKYLRLRGCPWDEDTTTYASTDEIYNWAKSNGCPVAIGNPREKLIDDAHDNLRDGNVYDSSGADLILDNDDDDDDSLDDD